MCIRRETREKARRSLAFSRVSKPHTHITHMLRQCTSIVYILYCAYICNGDLKSVNHKIVTWNTNRPRRLYFTIFFNLYFLYFPIFSFNCICCHLFSADNISVFTYNFIHVIYISLNHIYYPQIPAKNLKIVF